MTMVVVLGDAEGRKSVVCLVLCRKLYLFVSHVTWACARDCVL